MPLCAVGMEHGTNTLMAVKKYLLKTTTNMEGVVAASIMLPFQALRSGLDAASPLKVRKVLKARVEGRMDDLKNGWGTSFSLSVRQEPDGSYTVFDGNHRYHAIDRMIRKQGEKCIYNMDSLIPCVLYTRAMHPRCAH